ncbi:MAG: hypothetical protein JOY82_21530 [Streptosporangiaceae bacterium]|nr:hypothetical protein [Streptosporangiaceae bacterium]
MSGQASLDAYVSPSGGSQSGGSLCVSVQRTETSIRRGQSALYVVNVWTRGGNATGAAVTVAAQPSGQRAKFTLGCGSQDGTRACGLGAVDSASSARQLQAQIAVASNANSVNSVTLTATASAKGVTSDPSAAESVSVTAAPRPSSSPTPSPTFTLPSGGPTGSVPGSTSTLPTGIGFAPSLNGAGSSLSPGGSVSGLFPTINPSAVPSPAPGTQPKSGLKGEPVADSATLPLGTPVLGAQLAGLAALALAVALAITRLSIRRRPAPKQPPGN